MRTFVYTAVDVDGIRSAGEVSSETQASAISILAERGLMVAKIRPQSTGAINFTAVTGKLGAAQLERFTSELGLLLKNGVRIDKGLSVLVKNTPNPVEQRFLQQVLDDVRGGATLSSSLSGFPELFSDTYLNLIRTGEASGRLDEIFLQLTEDLKFRRKLNNQVIQALTYPSVILLVCLLSIAFVFNYIVPQMAPLFSGAAQLPGYTVLLLSVSDWFRDYQWYFLATVAISLVFFARAMRSRQRRDKALSHIMSFPVVGSLVLLVNQVQANSTLSITLASGLPVDRAFGLAANSVRNKDLRQGLLGAQERIRRGESPSIVLRGNPLYPDFYHSLIEVGEESGDLQPCFAELADRARSDFELRIGQLTSVLEPILILFMGAIVGGVVVTMLLSVVSVNDISL
jgi:type II secretory pathway component PulF